MLSIPLPFVVTLMLLTFLARTLQSDDQSLKERAFFLALFFVCILQTILSGLRWNLQVDEVKLIQPVIAATLPVLIWASFTHVSPQSVQLSDYRMWAHIMPIPLVAILRVWDANLIDYLLIGLAAGYSFAMYKTINAGPSTLPRLSLNGVVSAFAALKVATLLLISTAIIDGFILFDFIQWQGAHVGVFLSASSLIILLALCIAASMAGQNMDTSDAEELEAEPVLKEKEQGADDVASDAEILTTVDALLKERGLFKDPNLSLSRLARRAGVPSRQISIAINRSRSMNVSQYVNQFRIEEACRLLTETDYSVTRIIDDAGFQTKSNFNREFLRITGKSPTDWRNGAINLT